MKYIKSRYNIALDEYRQKRYRAVIENLTQYLKESKITL